MLCMRLAEPARTFLGSSALINFLFFKFTVFSFLILNRFLIIFGDKLLYNFNISIDRILRFPMYTGTVLSISDNKR